MAVRRAGTELPAHLCSCLLGKTEYTPPWALQAVLSLVRTLPLPQPGPLVGGREARARETEMANQQVEGLETLSRRGMFLGIGISGRRRTDQTVTAVSNIQIIKQGG